MNKFTICIDTREKDIEKLTSLLDSKGIIWVRKCLSVGDYVINDDEGNTICIIERKRFTDFAQSIKSGHLESQLSDMDKSDALQYVFIDGNYNSLLRSPKHKMSVDQLNGFKIHSQRIHKARIVQFDTTPQMYRGLVYLVNQLARGDVIRTQLPERTTSSGNNTIDLFLSIDGIGIKTAEKLYECNVKFDYLYQLCHELHPILVKDLIKSTYSISLPIKSIEWISELR